MKSPLPYRVQLAILRACVRDWRRVVESRCCRFILRRKLAFSDAKIAEIIGWLSSTDGDWILVRHELRRRDYAPKLFAWCDAVKGGKP